MTQSLITGLLNGGISANTTNYWGIGTGKFANSGTETNESFTWRTAGTFSYMNCYASANTVTANSALRFRTNTANGNQDVVITASTTGSFTDSSDVDTISAGANIDYGCTTGATGTTLSLQVCSVLFNPTTQSICMNKLSCLGSITDSSLSTAYYQTIAGNLNTGNTASEVSAQFKNKLAAVMKNMVIRVTAVSATTTATVVSRIAAGSSGNLSCAIPVAAGIVEDTTDVDSITSGTLINTRVDSTAINTFTLRVIAIDLVTSLGKTHYVAGDSSGPTTIAPSGSEYLAISQGMGINGTSSQIGTVSNISFTSTNLEAYVVQNSITANTTVDFSSGNTALNQNITFSSTSTGYQEDTTDSDVVTTSATINYRTQTGSSTGGTTVTFTNIGMVGTYPFSNYNDPIWFGMTS